MTNVSERPNRTFERIGLVDLANEPRPGLLGALHETALVERPREYGPAKAADAGPERYIDVVASDFVDLAGKLGV